MTGPMFLAFLWSLLLLVIWLALPRLVPERQETITRAGIVVASAALVARLVPNFLLPQGAEYDIESYRMVANLLLHGQEVYAGTASLTRHPYLPLQMYWIAFASWAASILHLAFVKVVRLAPIAADVAIALLLFLSLRRTKPAIALWGGLAFALNPISVFVSAYHGQFDAIPLLFTVLSVYWLDRSALAAGGWLGLGILNKSWPVLALPSLFVRNRGWKNRLLFVGAALLVPLLGAGVYVLAFGARIETMARAALGYNWGIGIWGYTYLVRVLTLFEPWTAPLLNWLVAYGRYLTVGMLGLAWLLRARREAPASGILTILVTFFAVTHAFSIQYLMWLVPFAILAGDRRWFTRYTLAAYAYMFLVYATLIFTSTITRLLPMPQADWFVIMPAGLPVWLVAVGWAWDRLRKGTAGAPLLHDMKDRALKQVS